MANLEPTGSYPALTRSTTRTSNPDACQVAYTVGWITPLDGLRVDFAADNLTDEDFQSFPGTPAPRRQFSVRTQYAW